jgi:hypothetical protein
MRRRTPERLPRNWPMKSLEVLEEWPGQMTLFQTMTFIDMPDYAFLDGDSRSFSDNVYIALPVSVGYYHQVA